MELFTHFRFQIIYSLHLICSLKPNQNTPAYFPFQFDMYKTFWTGT